MRNVKIYFLCILILFSGCKTVKKVLGIGESKEEHAPKGTSTEVAAPPSSGVAVTSTTLSNWALYSLITLIILFSAKYGLKKYKQNK